MYRCFNTDTNGNLKDIEDYHLPLVKLERIPPEWYLQRVVVRIAYLEGERFDRFLEEHDLLSRCERRSK